MIPNHGGESCLVLGRGREVPTAHVGGRRREPFRNHTPKAHPPPRFLSKLGFWWDGKVVEKRVSRGKEAK